MFPLSLSVLLGWTEGEGKCSSVTTSLTQTESVSVFHFVYTDLVPSSVVKTHFDYGHTHLHLRTSASADDRSCIIKLCNVIH